MPNIATIEEVRGWILNDESNSSQDATLEPLRLSVDEIIKDYCDCLFGETEALTGIILDSRRSDVIVPDQFPIVSVEKIVMFIDGDGVGGVELQANEYIVREEEIILRTRIQARRRGNISIDLTHGFADVPHRIHQALLLSVEGMYNRKTRRSIGLSSRSKEGESESYGAKSQWDSITGLPIEAMGMLQHYRRIEFTGSVMQARNQ